MPEAWSHLEGHAVNGKFHLNKYLGGSEQSAVFLTNHPEHGAATIKLIASDPANAELQLGRWREAQKLSHPNLVRIFNLGRCHLDGRDLIFAVMEHAEESLGQILSERPLTAQEVREMLVPILDVLAYLHVQGFVLGSLKPGNVLANNDQLKLSSDGIGRIGEAASHLEQPSAYDAPEMAGGRRSPAADVWSLGMTLVEVLTQHLPVSNPQGQADPALKDILPTPFQEIVRGCLRRDPKSRFTVVDVTERLYAQAPQPQPNAADVKPVPQKQFTAVRGTLRPDPSEAGDTSGIKQWIWRTAFPVALTVVGAAVLYAGFGFLRHPSGPQPEAAAPQPEPKLQAVQKPQSDQAPGSPTRASRGGVEAPARPPRAGGGAEAKPDARHVSRKSEAGRGPVSAGASLSASAAIKPQEASLRSGAQPSTANLSSNDEPDRGLGVVRRVVPDVPKSASDSIQGTIKISVRVNVDSSGGVTGTDMVVPGPSKYFARLSRESAEKWKFVPSTQGAGREFLLHFEFRNIGTRAYAER